MISRSPEYWHLPGPKRFLDDARTRVVAGDLLVIEDTLDPKSSGVAVCAAVREMGIFECIGPAHYGGTLAASICAAAGIPTKSLPLITADSKLRGSIVVVVVDELTPNILTEMKSFGTARAMLTQIPDPPIAIALVTATHSKDGLPAGWSRVTTDGIVDPMDTLLFVSGESSGETWLIRRLKSLIAVEVGAWDVELVATLSQLPLENAVRPDLCPDLWARSYQFPATLPSWGEKSSSSWGDESVPHAAWLAENDQSALRKRVWTGQLTALLPWIEKYRIEVTQTFETILNSSASKDRFRQAATDLDWGPIMYAFRAAGPKLPSGALRLSESMRAVRNDLAHGRPSPWKDIKAALDAGRAFSNYALSRASSSRIRKQP